MISTNSNKTMATSNNSTTAAIATTNTTNILGSPPPSMTSAPRAVQYYHRSGWSYRLQGGAIPGATILENIKEEPSSRSLASSSKNVLGDDDDDESVDVVKQHASKEETCNLVKKQVAAIDKKNSEGQDKQTPVIIPQPQPQQHNIPQPEPQQQQEHQHQQTSSMESFMLGHEYQYKLLATTTGVNDHKITTTNNPPVNCCFVPFPTIGSSGLLSLLPVVAADTSNNGSHDSNTKFCIVGIVEQHPSCPDDESNDSSDNDSDIGGELMFWMASLNKNHQSSVAVAASPRAIHLRGSEMIRYIRKMQHEDSSSPSSGVVSGDKNSMAATATKRHFLMYSMNDSAFLLKDSNDIVRAIQESMTTTACSSQVREAKELVNKNVVEVKETETVVPAAPRIEEESEDLDDDDDTQDAVNASLDVLVPSDLMKPIVVKSTTNSSTNNNDKNKEDKSGRRRPRRRLIKLKWIQRLKKSLVCRRRRQQCGGSGCSGGSSTAAGTTAATLNATHGEITPAASSLSSSSSSSATATHGHENNITVTKNSDSNIIDI